MEIDLSATLARAKMIQNKGYEMKFALIALIVLIATFASWFFIDSSLVRAIVNAMVLIVLGLMVLFLIAISNAKIQCTNNIKS